MRSYFILTLFLGGGGGESIFFIPIFGTSMMEKYKAGQSSVK